MFKILGTNLGYYPQLLIGKYFKNLNCRYELSYGKK